MIRSVNITKSTDPRRKQDPWMVDYRDPLNQRHRKYFPTKGHAVKRLKRIIDIRKDLQR